MIKKLAVHLHLYYIEQLDDILKKLHSLDGIDFDLFVTLVNENNDVCSRIIAEFPLVKVFVIENRGYDVGPFIEFLHKINLDDYEYVLKVHSKGKKSNNYTWINGRRFDNALWGEIMWDSMLGSKRQVLSNIGILENNNEIGGIGSIYCYSEDEALYNYLLDEINVSMRKIGLKPLDTFGFVAGCMFLCRAKLLKPLLVYGCEDFELTDGKVKDNTLAHVLERVLGAIVKAQGYKILAIKHGVFLCGFWGAIIKRFLYQKKVTRSGKTIIKVCKIPVYSKCLMRE